MATLTPQDKHVVAEFNKMRQQMFNPLYNEIKTELHYNERAWKGGTYESLYRQFLKKAEKICEEFDKLRVKHF